MSARCRRTFDLLQLLVRYIDAMLARTVTISGGDPQGAQAADVVSRPLSAALAHSSSVTSWPPGIVMTLWVWRPSSGS